MTLREWLSAEPFTLTLSSGFFGFFAHAGLLSVLEEEQLLPARVSGSSAGALVGSLWASGRSMPELVRRLFALRKNDFWDPAPGLGLLKGELFREILREEAAVGRLEECRVALSVSAFDGYRRTTRVFDAGPFDTIVYAACAVPFLFQPAWIERRPFWDGGIRDRPGLAGIDVDSRVFYHHLKSHSKWRKQHSPGLSIPARDQMTALVIDGLPKLGPNRLNDGPQAYQIARQATLESLDRPWSRLLRAGQTPSP